MTASVADILRQAADLIEPKGAWTKHAMAREIGGRHVPVESTTAVCWCAVGAIVRLAPGYAANQLYCDAIRAIERQVGGPVPAFNDAAGRTQAEVVAALRAAADKAEAS
jgi:hypothetical protein